MDLPTSPKKPSYIQSKQRKQALIAAPKEISLEAKQIFKPCLDINNISLQEYRGIFCTICVHTLPSRNWPRIFRDCHHERGLSRQWSAAEKPKICEQNFWQRSLAGWQVGGRLQTTGFKAILKNSALPTLFASGRWLMRVLQKLQQLKRLIKKVRFDPVFVWCEIWDWGGFLRLKAREAKEALDRLNRI